ncbi:MAG: SAM-dependent methyltransferase [Brevundimonas sp.]
MAFTLCYNRARTLVGTRRQPWQFSTRRRPNPAPAPHFPVASVDGERYRSPVQTLDPVSAAASGGLTSPAVARNTAAILAVLQAHLPARGRVLEIAAGSGEHAVAFARGLPGLQWTPSDPSPEARASITAWRDAAALPNLAAPLALDAADPLSWPPDGAVNGPPFEAVVCINMIHISPWAATEGLMSGAARMLRHPGGLLCLYGPYREADVPLAPSNAAFDESLKARDPDWGLRALEDVVGVARAAGLVLTLRTAMPANNLCLLFRRVQVASR